MMKIEHTALLLFTLFAFSCGNVHNDTNKTEPALLDENLPEYVANPGMENPSIYLRIAKVERRDSSFVCTLKALNDVDTIAFELEVDKGIKPGLGTDGSANTAQGFTEGTMRFKSVGQKSDSFIRALGDLYQIPIEGGMKQEAIAPLVFSSNTKMVTFANNETYSFKLFFENTLGKEAEVFAVIDLYKRLFEFRSKDVMQFARIIDAFQNQGEQPLQ